MMLNLVLQVISFVQCDPFLKAAMYVLLHEACSFKAVIVEKNIHGWRVEIVTM